MNGFVDHIESIALENTDFRRVLYTSKFSQLVVMSLLPSEEIGEEVHKLDQFFHVEEGTAEVVMGDIRLAISSGFALMVPAGTKHNIINSGAESLKLYTLYSPPNHRDGVVHHTRGEANDSIEHFDGTTTG